MPKELTMVPPAPPDRGELVYDTEIPDRFFKGLPGIKHPVAWVRRNLPKETRIRIGQHSCWYVQDVEAYIRSLKGKGLAA